MNDFIDDDLIDERNGEEPLDPTLAALARDYNAPPITPREAIWAGIERGRERTTAVTPLPLRRRVARWIPIAAGIAALLLVPPRIHDGPGNPTTLLRLPDDPGMVAFLSAPEPPSLVSLMASLLRSAP